MVARGIRNNNPGNIRKGEEWNGLDKEKTKAERDFCVFKDVVYGIRALCKVLLNYDRFYNINTVQGIITRYAPALENDTTRYTEYVCKKLNVDKKQKLDLTNPDIMIELIKALITYENGGNPYTDAQIRKGMSLAGIKKEEI